MTKKVEPARQADALTAPRAIFEGAKGRAVRANKVANLELLWSVLMEIREIGGRDYSLAEVGRRLEEKGGMKTQSLRNAGGADFREIITAVAQSVLGSPRYIAKTKSNVDQALDFIGDPSVRAVLKEEIAQAKKLREENAMLRHAFSKLSIPREEELWQESQTMFQPQATVVSEVQPVSGLNQCDGVSRRLSRELLAALKKGSDPKRIRKQGFTVKDDGSIENARGDALFPPGFLTACKAILVEHGEQES